MIRLTVFGLALWIWSQLGVAQFAPAIDGGLGAEAGRGIISQTNGFVEMQQTCPQRVGDAWDTVNERAWNTLEIGIQIHPEDFSKGQFEGYTRYNCMTPFDRPTRPTY